ncbi:hypothetical protein GLYMA_08G095500v4 [Glycine max]|nr:hypothetical protein GLYMA_08G095500v4 [Glycine max]KAH1050411.1 hypothetical protein GYH30_020749 [Glycine max]
MAPSEKMCLERMPMELIQKEKARKTTFNKRKKGLLKKAYEFSILCAVDVGIIIYAPKFLDEPETWPQDQDSRELKRVIQKYQNTTSDRCPKVYSVQEYFNDKMKKIEGEISKVHKEKIKLMYPTWNDSYNTLGEEQLRMFVSILDAKFDACSQRMNMLKKGKDKVETLTPYMTSNVGMQNMSQTQFFPPSDNKQVAFYPFQLSQSSQPSMFHFDKSCMQLMGKSTMVDWADQVGVDANCDPKMGVVLKEDGSDKNQNSYYNRNLPSHLQYDATFQTLPDQPRQPPGFELNGFYDSNMLQPHFFNYMHGRN